MQLNRIGPSPGFLLCSIVLLPFSLVVPCLLQANPRASAVWMIFWLECPTSALLQAMRYNMAAVDARAASVNPRSRARGGGRVGRYGNNGFRDRGGPKYTRTDIYGSSPQQ